MFIGVLVLPQTGGVDESNELCVFWRLFFVRERLHKFPLCDDRRQQKLINQQLT